MYLEIPSKLEHYIDDIKKQVKYINPGNKIILLRVGSSVQRENKKIMFLIYNPFAIDIDIDCNFFTNESQIFKLYPSQFSLKPNTAQAFIAFTSNTDGVVEIDEQKYIMYLRNKIFKRLSKLNNLDTTTGYKSTHIFNIDPLTYQPDETIYLNDHIKDISQDLSFEKFDTKYLDIKIENMQEVDDKFQVTLCIINTDKEHNFHVYGYNLKFVDGNNKAIINIKQELVIKNMTKKKFNILFSQKELANFNLKNMKIKLVFI